MLDAYIGVGSNIRPEVNLLRALTALRQHVMVSAAATVYRTAPIGRPEQAEYLNTVWKIRTAEAPRVVKFEILRPVETLLGRVRITDKYAARSIDLDLIAYGDQVVHEADLVLPDPDIRTRPFLAIPLLELAPTFIMPDTGEPLTQVAAAFGPTDLTPVPTVTHQLKRMLSYE